MASSYSMADVLNKFQGITSDLVQAMQSRLNSLGYSIVVSKDLTQFTTYIDKIVSNISQTIKKSIAEGGLGYTDDEHDALVAILTEGIDYAKTLMTTLNAGVTDSNKSVLSNNAQLKYLPVLDYTEVTDAEGLFSGNTNLISCPTVDLSKGDLTSFKNLFKGDTSLKNIEKIIWEDGEVINFSGMFQNTNIQFDPFEFIFGTFVDAEGKKWYDLRGIEDISYFMAGVDSVKTLGNIYMPDCTNAVGVLNRGDTTKGLETVGDVYMPSVASAGVFGLCNAKTIGTITMSNQVTDNNSTFILCERLKNIGGVYGIASNVSFRLCKQLTNLAIHNILVSLEDDAIENADTRNLIGSRRPTIIFPASNYTSYMSEYGSDDMATRVYLGNIGWTISSE